MANRLVMLKLVGPAAGGKEATGSVRAKAVLMLRVEGESVSIENGALVKASSHQAWSAFQVSTARRRRCLSIVTSCIPPLRFNRTPAESFWKLRTF